MQIKSILFLYACAVNLAFADTVIPTVVVKKPYTQSVTSGDDNILTQAKFKKTGVSTLSQALQNLGGVQLTDITGSNSQVLLNMRGFGSNANSNVLMLVNGIPLTNPDIAPPDLNAIPLSEIAYIEIIAGSESVRYGDQAVGGIINIVTEDHAPEKARFVCSTGSYHAYNCDVALHARYARTQFAVQVLDGHTANYRSHNNYDQKRLFGNLTFMAANDAIAFNYQIANENLQYPGALTATQVRQNRRQANNNIDYFNDWNDFLSLRETHVFSNDWQLATNIADRTMHGHGVLIAPFQQSRSTQYLQPTLTGNIHHVALTNGLEYQHDAYHLGSDYGVTNVNQNKYGLFTLASWTPLQHLSLSAGARGAEQTAHLFVTPDANNNINRAFATTLGGSYQLRPDLQFYLRRAGSFRFPKADENTPGSNGAAGLRTQRGIAYETGATFMRDVYSAKINLYQLNLKDEIAFDPTQTPQNPFGVNRNLPPTMRRGFTISGKDDLTSRISVDTQYNFVDARFQNGIYADKRIPLVSQNVVRGGVQYHFWDRWYFYTEALFTGNQYADNDNANIAGKIGGYTTFNFNLRYEYAHLTASLRLNNIFNKYAYLYTVYQPSLLTSYFYPAPGRNVLLTLNYQFV